MRVCLCYLQRQGRLPWAAADEDERFVVISRYGMKVTDVRKQVNNLYSSIGQHTDSVAFFAASPYAASSPSHCWNHIL